MKQIFELAEPFHEDSHPAVSVGDELLPVLLEASRAAGKFVVEAAGELGALHGWVRRGDLEQLRDAALEGKGDGDSKKAKREK